MIIFRNTYMNCNFSYIIMVTLNQGCYPFLLMRAHFWKIFLFTIFLFFVFHYVANLFLSEKVLTTGLTWMSYSLQHRFGISDEAFIPVVYESSSGGKFNQLSSISNITFVKNSSWFNSNETSQNTSRTVVSCPLIPPKLVGSLKVLTNAPSMEELEEMFMFLEPGGRYKPQECIARHKVAIIIPYRDREEHLRVFLHNIHPILQRQQLDYGVFVIEESEGTKFNRAMLMNIGFIEALHQYKYNCFIFHDVDLIPEDDRNLYTCPEQPRHMSVAINTMNYRLPYKDIFGGVSALTEKHMRLLNGFSNEFWGWGGEDDDMSNRIKYHGLKISRYSAKIARYTMLKHHKDEPNPERYNKLYKGKYRYKKDGLSNLKYNRLDLVLKKLYTWVHVEIEPIRK